jgi:hypothetical protein
MGYDGFLIDREGWISFAGIEPPGVFVALEDVMTEVFGCRTEGGQESSGFVIKDPTT